MMMPPLFILAPPRSFTSIVCAMLGQHPQMYGFPETQLFTTETLAERWNDNSEVAPRIRHGLLRVAAQLFFGEQTAATIQQARGWLRRRAHLSTGFLFELLAERIYPLIPVEKSPDVVYRREHMQRLYSMFPQARFIHLLRHPRSHGESNIKYFRPQAQSGQLPASHWMFCPAEGGKPKRLAKILDPQHSWFVHNMNICQFLISVPDKQKMRIRGEDLLRDPDTSLGLIAGWLGLRTDAAAIEEMKHPERSPYAFRGPPGALYGNSGSFLENPALCSDQVKIPSLEGPLSWREDGQGFSPRVKRLARQFGYK